MGNAAAWYRRDDYGRIRLMMDDGPKMPTTFDEWERTAKSQIARAAADGIVIQKVVLRPDDFEAYCKAEKLTARGSRERAMYAIARASAKSLH